MKILYLGPLAEGQTCRMRMEELRELGHEVIPLDTEAVWQQGSWAGKHLQKRLGRGPAIDYLNDETLHLAERQRPSLFWGDKQEFIRPGTLEALRARGIKTVHFTPDPYFSLSWKRTRLMDACMPLFECVITSKQYELQQYRQACRKVVYMPLGFSEKVHRPAAPNGADLRRRFASDVCFVGGWEPRREQLLDGIAEMGCGLKIWGYAWDHLVDGRWTPRRAYRLRITAGGQPFRIARNERLAPVIQGGEVYGDEYAWAVSGARISIGFLRKVCPDQHTTRTFEIPACGSMMLADRTDEHREFFEEGKEAEFFSSKEELLDKTAFYLKNESARLKIARAGHLRCLSSGYSYRCRLSQALKETTEL